MGLVYIYSMHSDATLTVKLGRLILCARAVDARLATGGRSRVRARYQSYWTRGICLLLSVLDAPTRFAACASIYQIYIYVYVRLIRWWDTSAMTPLNSDDRGYKTVRISLSYSLFYFIIFFSLKRDYTQWQIMICLFDMRGKIEILSLSI